MQDGKKKMRRGDACDAECGRRTRCEDEWTTKKAVRLIGYTIAAVCVITFMLRVSFVLQDGVSSIDRLRAVAEAELRQECCQIFYAPQQKGNESNRIKDCMHILQREKETTKTNRCETAKQVLKNSWWHQFAMYVWLQVIPFADIPFSEIVTRFVMSSAGWKLINWGIGMLADPDHAHVD